MKHSITTPPANTRWIMGNHDLLQSYVPFRFEIEDPVGTKCELLFFKCELQMIEALNIGPTYCASTFRLSDIVCILHNENSVGINTEFYEDDGGPIRKRFGVYWLNDKVRFLGEVKDGEPSEEKGLGAGRDEPKEVHS